VKYRPLSDLDGPLSHLLEERHAAEAALRRAQANVDAFIMAAEYLVAQAHGEPTPVDALPASVQGWVKRIEFRAAAKSVSFTQRAD
jgi:hypothetical protein